jgi:hypothetical protein
MKWTNWTRVTLKMSSMLIGMKLAVMENLTPVTQTSMEVDGASTSNNSKALRKAQEPSAKFVASQSQLKYIKSLLGAEYQTKFRIYWVYNARDTSHSSRD